jgi:Cu/Ag efflux protein CusF
MMRLALTIVAVGLAGSLAACNKKAASTETAAAPAASTPAASPVVPAPASDMGGMSGEAKIAKGTGTVTAVDTTTGAITVDHAPIAEIGWPAMTMGFKATPALAHSVKVGDKVAFDLKLQGGAGEITAIRTQ